MPLDSATELAILRLRLLFHESPETMRARRMNQE